MRLVVSIGLGLGLMGCGALGGGPLDDLNRGLSGKTLDEFIALGDDRTTTLNGQSLGRCYQSGHTSVTCNLVANQFMRAPYADTVIIVETREGLVAHWSAPNQPFQAGSL